MLALILGQKRRLLGFAGLMSFALMFLQLIPGSSLLGHVLGLLVAFLLMGGLATAVVVLQPHYRGWLEIVAIGSLLGSLLGQMTALGGLIGLPLAMALSGAGVMLLQLDWRRFWELRLNVTARREGQIAGRIAEVYAASLPGPSLISERLYEIETDAEDPQTLYAAVRVAGRYEEEATVTLVATKKPEAARFLIDGEDDAGAYSTTWIDVALTRMDPVTTHVSLTETREGLHPGDALRIWFDDAIGADYAALQAHFTAQALAAAQRDTDPLAASPSPSASPARVG